MKRTHLRKQYLLSRAATLIADEMPHPPTRRKRRRLGFADSKAAKIMATMPPLALKPDKDQPFDPDDSPALDWISNQRDLLQCLFDKARDIGAIRYDQATGCWSGVGTATQEDES